MGKSNTLERRRRRSDRQSQQCCYLRRQRLDRWQIVVGQAQHRHTGADQRGVDECGASGCAGLRKQHCQARHGCLRIAEHKIEHAIANALLVALRLRRVRFDMQDVAQTHVGQHGEIIGRGSVERLKQSAMVARKQMRSTDIREPGQKLRFARRTSRCSRLEREGFRAISGIGTGHRDA